MIWSQLRKRIKDLIAESVRGRIDFYNAQYHKAHDQEGRSWITIDKQEIINMPSAVFLYNKHPEVYRRYNNEDVVVALHANNIFCQDDLWSALSGYLNLSIDDVLKSGNPIIRAIGMLDCRVGKRRLVKMDVSCEHDLVKRFYYLRCNTDKIHSPSDIGPMGLTAQILEKCLPEKESVAVKLQEAAAKLKSRGKEDNLRNVISKIYSGDIAEDKFDSPILHAIYDGFKNTSKSDILLRFLLMLEGKTKLFDDVKFVKGLISLCYYCHDWVQPFDKWQPLTYNPDKQFSSLARYLFAKYDVPLFMDNAWFEENKTYQEWFIHIGNGKNIRTAKGLPMPLTKKMADNFLKAPDAFSVEAALRWGQVHALGGDRRIAEALLETRLVRDFSHNDFWVTVLEFFIRNPMLDVACISPIIDYINNRKFENRIVFVEPGVAQETGPLQPNFTMRGRAAEALLRDLEVWHKQLGRESKGAELLWKKSELADFRFMEGSEKNKNMRIWRIRELLSSKELFSEGRQMAHCVASYASSCYKGICSIWAMDVETDCGIEKHLTIEVRNQEKQICQIRGKRNRMATAEEMDIVNRWAVEKVLSVASYLIG